MVTDLIRVGVIGYGYWGPHLARNVADTEGLQLYAIADASEERRALARRRGGVLISDGAKEIFEHQGIDAVMIATSPSSHEGLIAWALDSGKHVLVTKPLAESEAHAKELFRRASKRGLVLLADHTFVYTGAVRKIKELLPDLGDLYYFDSVRVNLGLFQHDCDVVCDLAPHDFSILFHLLGQTPKQVQVTACKREGQIATAYVSLWFKSGLLAHLHLNWLSPVKIRRILIGGSKKMLLYDEEESSEKVKVYDVGVEPQTADEIRAALWDYRMGDCFVPHLDRREALAVEFEHFRDCIRGEAKPITGRESAIAVVRLLEAAQESLASGEKVEI